MATAARGGSKLMSLWKQGWNEIPEIMFGTFFGVVGIGMIGYGTWAIYAYDKNNKRYKRTYTVYRPEDERVKRIRLFDDSPPRTTTPPSLR